jgi:hypothetical protein
MLSKEATNTNFIVFGLTQPDSNPRSATLQASTLTITPPMWLNDNLNDLPVLQSLKKKETTEKNPFH